MEEWGCQSTTRLLESHIRGFLLAGSISVALTDVGKQEPTNTMDTICSRKECNRCLMVDPLSG